MSDDLSFEVIGLEDALRSIEEKRSFSIGDPRNLMSYATSENPLPKPDTDAYRAMVLQLYKKISKRDYNPASTELADVDLNNIEKNSFPWSTRDPGIASMYYFMLAETLKCFKGAPTGCSVLEFGPGWGETTLALARLGMQVTCIEINPGFVELIQNKAANAGVSNVRCLQGDFSLAGELKAKFDFVLFFECFHHAFAHDTLLDQCLDLLTENGVMVFSGEPVTDSFPVPWGVRVDAQSLFCVVKYGWMELGFSSDYFRHLLRSRGLIVVEEVSPQFTFFKTYQASRCMRVDFSTAPLGSLIGIRDGSSICSTGDEGVLVYGPYWLLEKGSYVLRCEYDILDNVASDAAASLAVTAKRGESAIAAVTLSGKDKEIIFSLDEDMVDVEFVIYVSSGLKLKFDHFLIRLL